MGYPNYESDEPPTDFGGVHEPPTDFGTIAGDDETDDNSMPEVEDVPEGMVETVELPMPDYLDGEQHARIEALRAAREIIAGPTKVGLFGTSGGVVLDAEQTTAVYTLAHYILRGTLNDNADASASSPITPLDESELSPFVAALLDNVRQALSNAGFGDDKVKVLATTNGVAVAVREGESVDEAVVADIVSKVMDGAGFAPDKIHTHRLSDGNIITADDDYVAPGQYL